MIHVNDLNLTLIIKSYLIIEFENLFINSNIA